MKYTYEDLVVFICQRLFGISVQGFAQGADGGRDAKFVGTAQIFPSESSRWTGTTIIQAKHTIGYNKHFSEPDFYSTKGESSILFKEIKRIKKLSEAGQLDNYILFANRRLAGNAESEIQTYISTKCNLPVFSVYLCGIEQLESWLKTYSDIPEKVNLDPVDSPLIVSPDDLADVISSLAIQRKKGFGITYAPPTPRTSYEKKNTINKMSKEYAKTLRERYLKETAQIYTFLSAPENYELMQLYEDVVDEFQLKIIAKRKDHQNFDSVMNHLFDLLFKRDPILRKHKRLTRIMLFYMYWNCDIGETEDA